MHPRRADQLGIHLPGGRVWVAPVGGGDYRTRNPPQRGPVQPQPELAANACAQADEEVLHLALGASASNTGRCARVLSHGLAFSTRLPSGDDAYALPGFGVVADQREVPAELDRAGQLAAFL